MPRIIFDSKDLLVLDKPAGLIVHSDGRTKETSVAAWLLARYPELTEVGEPWVSPQGERVLTAGIVHRLDRTTSGVILVAKSNEMYAYLKRQFKERKVEKTYLAYVYGHTLANEGAIVAEIARSSEPPKQWYAKPTTKNDRRAAITEWTLIKKFPHPQTSEPVSLLELRPMTGRTHQIRVHLASIDHPIVADHLYAPERPKLLGFERPALHAASISITLPNGERRTFQASLPNDFICVSLAVDRTGDRVFN